MDKVQELIERPLLFSLILSSPSQPRLSIITDGGEGENVDVSCCGPGVNTGCGSAYVTCYGKPDYQASATVISESRRVMAITDETWSDSGTLEDLGHCGNESGKPLSGTL